MDAPDAAITFSDFILMLATDAAVAFGDIVDPRTGKRAEPNLRTAMQVIELITMLQERTRGNLIEPEERLIDDLLYELRLRYVKAQQGEKRIIEP